MMVFVGPVEIAGVIGVDFRKKHDGGVVFDLVDNKNGKAIVGAVHLHEHEVDKIVRLKNNTVREIGGRRHETGGH